MSKAVPNKPPADKPTRGRPAETKATKTARRPARWAVVTACALAIAGGLWMLRGRLVSSAATRPPDILLVSIDTLRADRLGCYGYAAAQTRNIDRLAAGGVVFDAAASQVPLTLPSHASMLTGLIPPRHGARLNEGNRVPDEVTTLAETLRGQGYQTGAFVAALPMARIGGLDQGFDIYDDKLPQVRTPGSTVAREERYAEEVLAAARDWLRGTDARRPVFAFVHLYDPHAPHEKPLPGTNAGSYDGEIAYVDRSLGPFLTSLHEQTRWSRLLTVLTADHGEALGEHGEQTHGLFVYEATLRVPLIFHWPGVIAPRRVRSLVGIIDIPPTILALAKLPGPLDIDGQSLAGLMEDQPASGQRELYFESLLGSLEYGWAPLRGMRSADLKYISAPRPELYDLQEDPRELNNVHAARTDDAAALAEDLSAIGEGRRARAAVDQQTLARLATLGYISAPPVPGGEHSKQPDPKDRIEVYEKFQLAHVEFAKGRFAEALTLMEELEPSFDCSPYFYLRWGNFAVRTGDWPRGVRCYEKCLALDPQHQEALLNLGVAYLKSSDPQRSLAQFETLLQINADHVEALLYAGELKSRYFQAPAEAVPYWTRFLKLAPNHPQAEAVRKALAAPRN